MKERIKKKETTNKPKKERKKKKKGQKSIQPCMQSKTPLTGDIPNGGHCPVVHKLLGLGRGKQDVGQVVEGSHCGEDLG